MAAPPDGDSTKKLRRSLLKKWFYKTRKNGGRMLRSWFLYLKLWCGLYCFCCRLFLLGNDHSLFAAKTSITFLNLFGLGLAQPIGFLSISKTAKRISFSPNVVKYTYQLSQCRLNIVGDFLPRNTCYLHFPFVNFFFFVCISVSCHSF